MSSTIKIKLVDPKARGLLQELEHLGIIEILDDSNSKIKAKYLNQLSGKNLKDLDIKDFES